MDDEKELTTTENTEAEEKQVTAAEAEEREIVAQEGETESSQPEEFFTETIDALRKERDYFYDQLLRKHAEFDNYRKRVEKEKADSRFQVKQEILRELLNVLDACERGLENMDRHDESLESYREGYELLHKQINSLLAKFGVEPIEAVGQQFDPNIHEAILHEPSDTHGEGEVMEEIKKGYRLQDRLLRPAQVKVARTSESPQ